MITPPGSDAGETRSDVFRHPLEFIFADHDRQRIICAVLELLAGDLAAADAPDNAAHALDHLENQLPLHIADEEINLFPMLRLRCLPDDRIDEMLALLQGEHREDDVHCAALLAPLRGIAAGGRSEDSSKFAALARGCARFARGGLGWANGSIRPLAGRRRTDADRISLGGSMATRRGMDPPEMP